jgi:RHS repeat-associated protein
VPRKGICLLVAFVMLFGPEEFNSLAQADVQYANLSTATWAQGNRDIHYVYDDNGSVIEKITAIKDEPDPQNNFEEKVTNTYNLQNRLAKVTTEDEYGDKHIVEYIYDDECIRVRSYTYDIPYGQSIQNEKTVVYLVDEYNHTGYAQTLEEKTYNGTDTSGVPDSTTTYLIGDDVIAQTVDGDTQYLLYDGHGSTRQLAEYDGSITIDDSYSYDGYGVLLQDDTVVSANPGKVSQQATSLLYAGEHFDTDVQQYYLRARWYNPSNGLFNRMDDYSGNYSDPQSLHKYLYCHANPINRIDPTGEFSLCEIVSVNSIMAVAIGALAPALMAGYEKAKAGGSIWEILRNSAIAYFISFGIGIGLVAAGPYIMAAAISALSLIPGVSASMAAAAIAIAFIGLTIYGGYELWTCDYPLWLKISVTAILALSVVVSLGKEGIKNLASKAKNIIKSLGSGEQPPAKQVRNPWGRRGSPAHRRKIDQVESRFRNKGWKHIAGGSKPEQRVYMPDGSYRYPDLIFDKGGKTVAINVGRATAGGSLIAREASALADLRSIGEEMHAFFVRY